MILSIVVLVGAVALGFGAGRIKSQTKLQAISAELNKVEATAIADVKVLVAKIKNLI